MRFITPMLAVFVLPAIAFAQGSTSQSKSPVPKSSMTVAIAGLPCTTPAGAGTFAVHSFSWGASNPVSFVPGSAVGKVSISSLHLLRNFDACSPVLFDAVSVGTSFNQVTLTQRNTDGDPVATIVLEGGVRVESWQLSSSTGEAAPTESVSLAAPKFCVTDVPSGNKFCYDFTLAKVS